MRSLVVPAIAVLLLLPSGAPAPAGPAPSLQNAPFITVSDARKAKKKRIKARKPRVEYMRAVPAR